MWEGRKARPTAGRAGRRLAVVQILKSRDVGRREACCALRADVVARAQLPAVRPEIAFPSSGRLKLYMMSSKTFV